MDRKSAWFKSGLHFGPAAEGRFRAQVQQYQPLVPGRWSGFASQIVTLVHGDLNHARNGPKPGSNRPKIDPNRGKTGSKWGRIRASSSGIWPGGRPRIGEGSASLDGKAVNRAVWQRYYWGRLRDESFQGRTPGGWVRFGRVARSPGSEENGFVSQVDANWLPLVNHLGIGIGLVLPPDRLAVGFLFSQERLDR
jgi:hypothetical protein